MQENQCGDLTPAKTLILMKFARGGMGQEYL